MNEPSQSLGYFSARWHAQTPWKTFFWRDLLLVGSLANALMGFSALIALSQGADVIWALGLHFALLPYNLFLLATVWRWPGLSTSWKWVSSAWFSMTLVI